MLNYMLDKLPEIIPQKLAIKLKPAAQKAVRHGHPWVFESGIVKQNKEGNAGDLAIIFDQRRNKFLAIGLFDPHSPIRIKILQKGESASIDTTWFQEKIETAFVKRRPLLKTDTNSYRFIYGENDGLPGFIADVYDHVLVVKLYSAIWLPFLKELLPILLDISNCKTLVLRLARSLQKMPEALHGLHDGMVLNGDLDNEEIIFREHGLRFTANVIHGHKTGYFLDHRHNRKRVGELSKGKVVLDIFAYAGGFSVHALAGGATEVTSLDISAKALAMSEKNVALNDLKANHRTMAIDAFKGLEQLHQEGKTFDLIIVDPPSFAKRESEREKALDSYARLAKIALKIVAKGGILLLASCSSRVTAEAFFAVNERILQQSGRDFQEMERHFHDIDHPIGFKEGAYLKAVYYRLD
jgi:23S rRNA (cytosine1962-C5)-methyltransferase